MKKVMRIGIPIIVVALVLAAYASWYSFERHTKIAKNEVCDKALSESQKQGVPQRPCLYQAVPPHLWDLVRGRFVFDNLPSRFSVTIPHSLLGILLGDYQLQPLPLVPASGCDQSATTTDCSKLPPLSQPDPQPYVPPDPSQPTTMWVSATGTPISLYGFSFELPAGWHGSVYSSAYTGNLHALVQSSSNNGGFTIDCPPDGKGLEAATRLSSEGRSFTAAGTQYSVSLEKWTAPGNDPWYFLWVRTPQSGDSSNGSSGTYCLVQGSAMPDIEEAMQTMYSTWNIKK